MIIFLKPVIPILGFSRETKPQEFAYVITEAEKSHKLPLSRRTRKASGLIQLESESLRTREID